MQEDIVLITSADVVNDDHGGAKIQITVERPGMAVSIMFDTLSAYRVVQCLDVMCLQQAVGNPIILLHDGTQALGMKRLPCYESYEVLV